MDVVIDTDPGGDDAIALMWLSSLARQGRVNLLAVTSAAGNVGAAMTFRNAAGILGMCGLGTVPVGIAPPGGATRDAAEVHGSDGIGGLAGTLPETGTAAQTAPRSTDLLIQGLSRTGRAPCLLAVAPLTNLARAESASPGILNCAHELIVMGGALGPGNITRSAEFNFFFDPPAAQSVLAARSETRLVTLETSQSLVLTPQHVTEIVRGLGERPAVRFFQELCRFMGERDSRLSPGRPGRGFPVHDAATVAWLAYPELFKSRQCRVRVESSAGKGRGQLTETADPAAAACRIVCGVAADALLAKLAADLRLLFAGL